MDIIFKHIVFNNIINSNQNILKTFEIMDSVIQENFNSSLTLLIAERDIRSCDVFSKEIENGFTRHEIDIFALDDLDQREKYLFSVKKKIKLINKDYVQVVDFVLKKENVFS
jgi:hypothetical protein